MAGSPVISITIDSKVSAKPIDRHVSAGSPVQRWWCLLKLPTCAVEGQMRQAWSYQASRTCIIYSVHFWRRSTRPGSTALWSHMCLWILSADWELEGEVRTGLPFLRLDNIHQNKRGTTSMQCESHDAGSSAADKCTGRCTRKHIGAVQSHRQRVLPAGPNRAVQRCGTPECLCACGAQPQEQPRHPPQRAGTPLPCLYSHEGSGASRLLSRGCTVNALASACDGSAFMR